MNHYSDKPVMMSTAQHDYILTLLIKACLLDNPTVVHTRTNESWGWIFDNAGCERPRSLWPTIEEWMNGLTIYRASKVIDTLKYLIHGRG